MSEWQGDRGLNGRENCQLLGSRVLGLLLREWIRRMRVRVEDVERALLAYSWHSPLRSSVKILREGYMNWGEG